MNDSQTPEERFHALSQAFPGIPDQALEEAEASIDRYLAIVLRIYDRLCSDPQAHRALVNLTAGHQHAEMEECTNPKPRTQSTSSQS